MPADGPVRARTAPADGSRYTDSERPEVGRPYFRVRCKFDSLNLLQVADGGSNSLQWWTRLQPIRTASEVELEFVVFTREQFQLHRIAAEAPTLRRLGMSLRATGVALGVNEKTVRKALAGLAS
jgi:hypothetical protein